MRSLIIFLITLLAFTSCRHYSQGFEAYFCTSTEPAKKSYLYIDDELIGLLPYIAEVPSCNGSLNKLLYTDLRAGNHLVQVKDAEGNILFSEKMRAGRNGKSSKISTSTKKRRWSSRIKVKDACLISDLRF